MITKQQFEEALSICEQYQSQLQKELTDVKRRIKEASIDKTNTKIINAAVVRLTKDSVIGDLKEVDTRIYNVLRRCFIDKDNTKLTEVCECSKAEITNFRDLGKAKVEQLEQILQYVGLSFKES